VQILTPPELLAYLQRHGLIAGAEEAEIHFLDGGVSSEIRVVKTPRGTFVVKQALEKLRVRDDWRCDPRRNLYEQEFLAFAQAALPGSVPRLLHRDPEMGLFAMEYLDGRWSAWKARLWSGQVSVEVATQAGASLGVLHRTAWGHPDLREKFDNTPLFHELRIAPYLLTTAERHPALAPHFEEAAGQLAQCRLTLVHGDYSPKNLLTDGEAVKIIDAEVAWYGDPAFDLAFLMTHLLLKAVRFPERADGLESLRRAFLDAYRSALGVHWSEELESRAVRLTFLLLMARISGKSPVEYFRPESPEARFVLQFGASGIASRPGTFSELSEHFRTAHENHPR